MKYMFAVSGDSVTEAELKANQNVLLKQLLATPKPADGSTPPGGAAQNQVVPPAVANMAMGSEVSTVTLLKSYFEIFSS